MRKRLTIHAGANKTGSSAIQAFLKRNAATLRSDGIVVPDMSLALEGPIEGHHVWFFDQRRAAKLVDAKREVTERLATLFGRDDVRQIVLSAENLGNNDNGFAGWFADIKTDHDVEAVIYLRRQDEFLLSSWQQWHVKDKPDLWSWLVTCIGNTGNWRLALQRWETVIGRDSVKPRLFERARLLEGDVVLDFCQHLVARSPALVNDRSAIVNPSYNEAVADLVMGGKFFKGPHDNAFYKFVERWLGEESLKRRGESAITFEQRMAILERYEQSNAWVRQNYFAAADIPETLFEMPARADYAVRTTDELRKEQIQMLARILFEMNRARQK